MRKLLFTFIAGLAFYAATAAEVSWLTDLPQAQALAKAEKKMVLLNFTGSNW